MREKLADVKADRDHYKKLASEGLEPRLRELHYGKDGFRAEVVGPTVELLALAFVSHFKAGGAQNFVEMSIYDRDDPFQRYTLTVQKVGALSLADKLNKAQARIVELEAMLPSATQVADAA